MSTHILAPIAVPSLLPACPDVEPEGTSEKKANNRPTDRPTEPARETKSRVHRTQKREREGRRRARAESESAHKEGTEPFAQELMDGKGWAGWAEHQWMTWTGAGDRSLGSGGDGQRERERERQKEKGQSIAALQPQCHPLPCSRYSAWRVNHGAQRRASARVRDREAERISAQHGKENREHKAVRGGAESTREAAQPCPLFAAPLKHTGNAPSLTYLAIVVCRSSSGPHSSCRVSPASAVGERKERLSGARLGQGRDQQTESSHEHTCAGARAARAGDREAKIGLGPAEKNACPSRQTTMKQ